MSLDPKIIEILKESKTIAVVGMSKDPQKAAHRIPKYLQSAGYRIIPVNPTADEILGEKLHETELETRDRFEAIMVELAKINAKLEK